MTAADGVVVGTTKLVDHGPDSARWTLVLLAEGYQQAELAKFHADADAFVSRLFSTPPYTELWCALNIYRVDIASSGSGADDPAACTDGTVGTGTMVNTYFDSTFCVAGTRRLLAGDEHLADTTAKAAVPEVDATVVIVNAAEYGGAGGLVAWTSTNAAAGEIAVHELGHSAFGLGDEYGDTLNTYTGAEPNQPNLTIDTGRATLRWPGLIRATTALPTMSNPDCTTEDARPSPVPAGTIGLFEGGNRYHCGLYHAEYQCRMRRSVTRSAPCAPGRSRRLCGRTSQRRAARSGASSSTGPCAAPDAPMVHARLAGVLARRLDRQCHHAGDAGTRHRLARARRARQQGDDHLLDRGHEPHLDIARHRGALRHRGEGLGGIRMFVGSQFTGPVAAGALSTRGSHTTGRPTGTSSGQSSPSRRSPAPRSSIGAWPCSGRVQAPSRTGSRSTT